MPARPSDSQAKKNHEQFLRSMDAELALLDTAAKQARCGPLDRSYESIDRLEDLLASMKQAKGGGRALSKMRPRAVRYLGATLIAQAGGRWDYGVRDDENLGRPCVADVPGAKDVRVFPRLFVDRNAMYGVPGSMRDGIERFDLELQRKQTARLARDANEEIAALGKELDVDLDFTLDSIDRMEQAIVARWQKAGRELRRRLGTRGGLYLGTVLQRALRRGEWSVFAEPGDADFGMMYILGWGPVLGVTSAAGRKKTGMLRPSVERRISELGAKK